jgi:hypothetical protein
MRARAERRLRVWKRESRCPRADGVFVESRPEDSGRLRGGRPTASASAGNFTSLLGQSFSRALDVFFAEIEGKVLLPGELDRVEATESNTTSHISN